MKIYITSVAILAWLAIALQFYLIIINRVTNVLETIIRFFSFFTILTNILVALCCTVILFKPKSGWDSFFSKSTTLTAITTYITVVGIVYNLILRFLWQPQGLQLVVDELLHSVVPVLFLLFWILFVPKGKLKWKDIFPWLIYPLIYFIYTLIRGPLSGFYPYPFIDVNELGYNRVLLNSGIVLIAFLLVSLLLVGVGKMTGKTYR